MTTRQRLKNWYDEQQAASRAEGLKEGVKQGIQKGRAEGQRTLLVKLLKLKFGKLDASTETRLASATPAQLGKWAERVLTAGTIDDIWA